MTRVLSTSALIILFIAIVLGIVGTALPSWVVVTGGFNDSLSYMNGGFYTSSGLFEMCQGFFNEVQCTKYTSYSCMGDPNFVRFCQNRNAAAGLMIAAIVASSIAFIMYAFIAFRKSLHRVLILVSIILMIISAILIIIAVAVMGDAKLAVEYTVNMASMGGAFGAGPYGPSGPIMPPMFLNMMNVIFGPAFIVAVVSLSLFVIGIILLGFHMSFAQSTKTDHQYQQTSKETILIHEQTEQKK